MKSVFGFIILIGSLAYVSCEMCTTNDDCRSTTCTSGTFLICHHASGTGVVTGAGVCTCIEVKSKRMVPAAVYVTECSRRTDCFGTGAPDLQCTDPFRHCDNQICICGKAQQ